MIMEILWIKAKNIETIVYLFIEKRKEKENKTFLID
jgi:hypothetical protein